MGITDIDISTELETNAPSIKYTGNEGPKSPQEEQMMMMQQMQEMDRIQNQEAGDEEMMMQMAGGENDRVRELLQKQETMGLSEMEKEELRALIRTISANRQVKDPRQMAAFGGIMGLDGRRQYGIGSRLKKFVRKVIPNEVSDIAVKAAPFVAPFNPALAAAMSGIGTFDQTGSISKGLKSGFKNYAIGQGGRYLGGADFQGNPFSSTGGFTPGTQGSGTFSKYFSKPTGDGGIKNLFNKSTPITNNTGMTQADVIASDANVSGVASNAENAVRAQMADANAINNAVSKIPKDQGSGIIDAMKKKLNLGKIGELSSNALDYASKNKIQTLLAASAIGGLMTAAGGQEETIDAIMNRGEGYDIDDIRTRVTAAFKDPSGKLLQDLRIEFPYLGTAASKNTEDMAMGGRIGYNEGGIINPFNQLETFKLKGLGYDVAGKGTEPFGGESVLRDILRVNRANGGRMGMEEGGIMDLGGMEKDYRAEGGFVPIGAKEKADDVPARLSVNEFVFTADAVRSAGGGDIDRGAEVMENMMKNLEQGGQVSEESQGMQGAQQMFETSERLSEVV